MEKEKELPLSHSHSLSLSLPPSLSPSLPDHFLSHPFTLSLPLSPDSPTPPLFSLLSHLIHDHLLCPSTSLASLDDGLQKLEVLDIPALLYTVYEVLDL